MKQTKIAGSVSDVRFPRPLVPTKAATQRWTPACAGRPRPHRLEQIGEALDLELGDGHDLAVGRKPRIAIEAIG